MELFYAYRVADGLCYLDAEESGHCVRVLRHRAGDALEIIDGLGTLYHCKLLDADARAARATVVSGEPGWGARPYRLTIGCCPTKNNDRFEWFVEKATEIGVDVIAPLIGERSERRVYKPERARRIALSATKQSLKARIPEVLEPVSVREFLAAGIPGQAGNDAGAPVMPGSVMPGPVMPCPDPIMPGSDRASLRLIAYCFEDASAPRISIREALEAFSGTEVTVLIGPEGDFSPEEARLALSAGYIPVHLGPSRLRTETAALFAASAVYHRFSL